MNTPTFIETEETKLIARTAQASSEAEARRVLRKFMRKIDKLLLSPELDRMLHGLIAQMIAFHQLMRRERHRKYPSKIFRELRRFMLNACEGELGRFAMLDPRLIETLDTLLDGFIKAFKKPPLDPVVDPADFIALQKKILISPKKRGPKVAQMYNQAYRRTLKGETVRSIAQDLQPDHYQANPDGTLRRFQQAVQRRKSAKRTQ